MSQTQPAKLPVWFWIFTVLAILWTIAGVYSFYADITMSEEALAALPQEQRDIYEARPSWVVWLYAIAVFPALLGAASLALRKSWATPLFGISLVAVVIQMGYVLFGMGVISTLGVSAAIFPAVIVILGAIMLWFSMTAKGKGWLH